jgi:hypothetical protein
VSGGEVHSPIATDKGQEERQRLEVAAGSRPQ